MATDDVIIPAASIDGIITRSAKNRIICSTSTDVLLARFIHAES